jgi:hypothetical protein
MLAEKKYQVINAFRDAPSNEHGLNLETRLLKHLTNGGSPVVAMADVPSRIERSKKARMGRREVDSAPWFQDAVRLLECHGLRTGR